MRAAVAPSVDVCRVHEAFAAAYARRINEIGNALGGSNAHLSKSGA